MATPVYLKSSSVTSKVPTTSTLSLRELGINTTDGILYLRQGTGVAGDIIIPVNPWKASTGGTTAYNTYFTAGNIGIGTTTPSSPLSVNGFITENPGDGTYWNVVTQKDIGIAGNQIPLNQYLGTMAFQDYNAININAITIGVGGTILVSSGSSIGIGVSTPTQALHVVGNSRVTGARFDSNNSSGSAGLYLQSTGNGTSWSTVSTTVSTLTFGTYLTGGSYNGSTSVTIGVAATSVSTGNSIVVRDASGNFSAGTITHGVGATSTPSINFSTGTSTGIYLPATNTLGISTAGVEAARIDASGNVGIGTTGVDKLTVLGRIQLQQDAGSNNRIVFRGTPGSSYRWSMDNYQSGNTFRIFREDDTTAANGYTALSLSSSGYLNGQIVGLGSGLYPAQQYYRLNSGLTGANSTAVQLPFGVSVTLAASTIYEFESYYILTKSSGTGSHTFSTGFTGTATVNNIISESLYFISTTALPPLSVNANSSNVAVGAGNAYGDKFTWTGALTATTITHVVLTKGTVSISTGGSFSPYYQLSGAPGTGYTAAAGSYYRIYPVGASGSNISIGTWA